MLDLLRRRNEAVWLVSVPRAARASESAETVDVPSISHSLGPHLACAICAVSRWNSSSCFGRFLFRPRVRTIPTPRWHEIHPDRNGLGTLPGSLISCRPFQNPEQKQHKRRYDPISQTAQPGRRLICSPGIYGWDRVLPPAIAVPFQGTYPSRAGFSHRSPEVRGHYLQNGPGLKPPKRSPLTTAALSSIRENPRNPRQNACFLPRIARILVDFRISKSSSRTTPTRRLFRLPSGPPTFFPCRIPLHKCRGYLKKPAATFGLSKQHRSTTPRPPLAARHFGRPTGLRLSRPPRRTYLRSLRLAAPGSGPPHFGMIPPPSITKPTWILGNRTLPAPPPAASSPTLCKLQQTRRNLCNRPQLVTVWSG